MRYSLASRFRGTLLGATIAEKITHQNHTIHPPVAHLLIPGLQSLIELGEFASETWIERLARLELTPLQVIIATLPLALFVHDNKIKLRDNLLSVARMWPHEPVMQESLLAVGYTIAQALTEQLSPLKLIPQIINFIDTPKTDLVDK